MPFPLTKNVPVEAQAVAVTVTDVSTDTASVLHCEATVGDVSYAERFTLSHDSAGYTQEQAQADFDAHCQKVARLAFARARNKIFVSNLI